uniref:Uncharacterized protein n=1 Tax=Athene cunicularia TaxID=194338 RepID=A0A663N4N7_ATHCN
MHKGTIQKRHGMGRRFTRQVNKAEERHCETFYLNKVFNAHVLNVKVECPLRWKGFTNSDVTVY